MVTSRHSYLCLEKGLYNIQFNKKYLQKDNMTAMAYDEFKEKPELIIYERKCLVGLCFDKEEQTKAAAIMFQGDQGVTDLNRMSLI